MAIDKQQYLDIARERYTQQFKEKSNIDRLVATWLSGSEEIQDVLSDVDDIKYIDKASGIQLDNIGEIVGQPRILIDADLIAFFGYQGLSISRSYGDLNDASKGGRWKALEESSTGNITLNDPEYRLFIRAKILRNKTVATTEDVIESIKFLFQAERVHLLEDTGPASYRVAIGKVLSQQEKNLIRYEYQDGVKRNLLVKPAGVGFDDFSEYNPEQFFGFDGVSGVKGYGTLLEVGEYVPYFTSFGMFGYGDLRDIADVNIYYDYTMSSRHTTRGVSRDGDSVDIPISNTVQEVYVDGAFTDSYTVSKNRVTFPYELTAGTPVTVVERFGQEVITTDYTFKDPAVTTLSRRQYESSFGDVNDPQKGSRYRSLGEPQGANNILNTGPIKKLKYFDNDATELTETGGYYSSIIT
jgi:hypothetical protein